MYGVEIILGLLLVLHLCGGEEGRDFTKRQTKHKPFNRAKYIQENCPGVQSLNSVLNSPKPVTIADLKTAVKETDLDGLATGMVNTLKVDPQEDSITLDWAKGQSATALCVLGRLEGVAERIAATGQISVCSDEFKKNDLKGTAECLTTGLDDVVKEQETIMALPDHPSGMQVAGVVTLFQMDIHGIAHGVQLLSDGLNKHGSKKTENISASGSIITFNCGATESASESTQPLGVDSLKTAVTSVGLDDWGLNLWQHLHEYVHNSDTEGLESYLETAWPMADCSITKLLSYFNQYFQAGEQQICDSPLPEDDTADVTSCILENAQQLATCVDDLDKIADDGSYADAVVLFGKILVGVSRAEHGLRMLTEAIDKTEAQDIKNSLSDQGFKLL